MFHVIGGCASVRRQAFAATALAFLILLWTPALAMAQDTGDEASSHASQAASERASETAAAAAQAAAEKAAAMAQAVAEQAAARSVESASAQAAAVAEQTAARSSEAAAAQAGDAAARSVAEKVGEKVQLVAEQSAARSSEDAAGRAETQAAGSSAEAATARADDSAAERTGSGASTTGTGESDAADQHAEASASASAASAGAAEDDRSGAAQAGVAAAAVDDGETASSGSAGDGSSRETGILARLTWLDRGAQLDVAHEPDGSEVVRHEFVALVDDGQTVPLRAGYRLVDRVRLSALGASLLRFRADRAAPGGEVGAEAVIEPNHVFRLADGTAAVRSAPAGALKASLRRSSSRGLAPLVGMVDSPVDTRYPGLRAAVQDSRSFMAGGAAMPSAHGTAVADILARQNVRVLAANAFGLDANGAGAASTAALITSLDWLVGHGARVINLSLTGPRDAALADAIRRAQARGCVIVAAAGNNGPAAPPAYPAAFPGVIAVTAIDRLDNVYRSANQGSYIAFSALGVDVETAEPPGRTRRSSGTSFAAPLVAASVARLDTGAGPQAAMALLQARARHLGEAGRNPVYGYGAIDPTLAEPVGRQAREDGVARPHGF